MSDQTPATPPRRGRPPSGGRDAIVVSALELVRERGIAHLTTREVAARAGFSEANIYYHFKDRAGLLRAIYQHAMKPLEFVSNLPQGTDLEVVLQRAFDAFERFFDEVLPVLHAAQADCELGSEVAAYTEEHDLGPQQGVRALGDYLRSEQQADRANPDVDADAAALIVIDAAFSRSARRQMLHEDRRVPAPDRVLATIALLLRKPG